jgi:hypothetical protein
VKEMKIEIDQDERTLIVRSLEQYYAYLVSQRREDQRYVTLADRLKGIVEPTRKPASPSSQRPRTRARR